MKVLIYLVEINTTVLHLYVFTCHFKNLSGVIIIGFIIGE